MAASVDPYASYEPVPLAPLGRAAAVTPSDAADLPTTGRALYVGGVGDVTLDTAQGDNAILFKAVPVGTWLWLRVKRVRATGTTATNLVVLW